MDEEAFESDGISWDSLAASREPRPEVLSEETCHYLHHRLAICASIGVNGGGMLATFMRSVFIAVS